MSETTSSNRDVIDEATDRFKRCVERESTFRTRALEDHKFGNADAYNNYQWDDTQYNNRKISGRPALTINKTRQHCLQIINDARQNKASVRIRPTGGGATYEAAQIFEGLIRHIEYQSNATEAYDKATWDQVFGGIGYWRIVTDYVDADSFDQEIYLRRIPDWRMVYLDPDIAEYDGSDATFGFIFTDMPNDAFDAKYPRYKSLKTQGTLTANDTWNTQDHTRVAEYFRKSMKPDTLFATRDGTTIKASAVAGTPMLQQLRDDPDIRSRRIMSPVIDWFKIAADKVIEKSVWAGSYIPIVRVVGEETVFDGVLDRKGHVRAMIDAQRMYNVFSSNAVEYAMVQTKSPYIAPADAIEGREEAWANANTQNAAVLTYNHKDENDVPIPSPVRQPAPSQSQAYIVGMQTATQELMSVSGQYQAELGMPSNEKSGVAIQQRQRQGDNATAHYIDHLAVAIRYTGRQLVDLIPKIYDTARVIRIMAEDGTDAEVSIDPTSGDAHGVQPQQGAQLPDTGNVYKLADAAKLIFNPNVGRYDVESDVGPNFGTQREEAFNAFSQIAQGNPEFMLQFGDIMFQNADFPGADEISERFKEQRTGSMVPAAHMQAAQQQVQQLHGLLQQMTETLADEKRKTMQKDSLRDVEVYNAETSRMSAVAKVDPAALLPLIRQMVSDVLGTPALPHIAAHQAANAQMGPQDAGPQVDPLAAMQAAHSMSMDRARLGLDAHQQGHDQAMAQAGLELQQKAAEQPQAAE